MNSDTPVDRMWGQMTITPYSVITPVGTFDLIGTRWSADESWESHRVRPGWSLMLGLLTWWTIVGIAFFYVRRTDESGRVTITMNAPNGAWWRETVPANSPASRSQLIQFVMVLDNWSIAASTTTPAS